MADKLSIPSATSDAPYVIPKQETVEIRPLSRFHFDRTYSSFFLTDKKLGMYRLCLLLIVVCIVGFDVITNSTTRDNTNVTLSISWTSIFTLAYFVSICALAPFRENNNLSFLLVAWCFFWVYEVFYTSIEYWINHYSDILSNDWLFRTNHIINHTVLLIFVSFDVFVHKLCFSYLDMISVIVLKEGLYWLGLYIGFNKKPARGYAVSYLYFGAISCGTFLIFVIGKYYYSKYMEKKSSGNVTESRNVTQIPEENQLQYSKNDS